MAAVALASWFALASLLLPQDPAVRRPEAETPPAARQDPDRPTERRAGPPPIRFDATTLILPPGALPIRDLVDATAQFLQRNILTDPKELAAASGPIELQTAMHLDRDGCEDAVSQLLHARGFVLLPRDENRRLYELVSMQGQRAQLLSGGPRRSPEQILARPRLQQPVSTVVTLAHANAVAAQNALRPFFANRGRGQPALTVGSAGDAQTLLLSGLQCDVAEAIGILMQVDAAAAAAGGQKPVPPDLQRRLEELEQTLRGLEQRIAAIEKRAAGGSH